MVGFSFVIFGIMEKSPSVGGVEPPIMRLLCLGFRTLHTMEEWDKVLVIEDKCWCKEVIHN